MDKDMPPRTVNYKKFFCSALASFVLANCSYSLTPPAFSQQVQIDKHGTPLDKAWKSIRIRAGDSLTKRLQDNNLAAADLSIMDTNTRALLNKLKPGEIIEIIPKNGHIAWLRYHPTKATLLLVQRKGTKLTGSVTQVPMVYNLNFKSVRIRRNLSSSEHAAQFSSTMIHDVERMFAGSIDLSRSLHKNDSLDVLYEEYYLKGVLSHTGHVVAATIRNKNK